MITTETCNWCGGELDVSWVDTSTLGGSFQVTRGPSACETPGCSPRCPTCRREPGDIHGPGCGAIIAGKLGDPQPCTITRADCGERWPRDDAATSASALLAVTEAVLPAGRGGVVPPAGDNEDRIWQLKGSQNGGPR